MRMSYSGNTLAFQAKARGSIPLIRLLQAQALLSFRLLNRCSSELSAYWTYNAPS